ncbi:MAG: hypothetical protein N2235_11645 [Fischerella sp.]|nr:hypothetical protein [Fischerella sp.]
MNDRETQYQLEIEQLKSQIKSLEQKLIKQQFSYEQKLAEQRMYYERAQGGGQH